MGRRSGLAFLLGVCSERGRVSIEGGECVSLRHPSIPSPHDPNPRRPSFTDPHRPTYSHCRPRPQPPSPQPSSTLDEGCPHPPVTVEAAWSELIESSSP